MCNQVFLNVCFISYWYRSGTIERGLTLVSDHRRLTHNLKHPLLKKMTSIVSWSGGKNQERGVLDKKGSAGKVPTDCVTTIYARGDRGKSFGWQHLSALVVEPRNPRYSYGLAVGEFMSCTKRW